MSSNSPNRPQTPADLVIIGSDWQAALAAQIASRFTAKSLWVSCSASPKPTPLPIFRGTGEPKKRVALAMGENWAEHLWEVSERNLIRCKSFRKLAVYREGEPDETGAVFEPAVPPNASIALKSLPKLDRMGSLTNKLSSEGWQVETPLVLVLDDRVLLSWSPELKTELIPVSLSVFELKAKSNPKEGLHLFNGGADYALKIADRMMVGSYRNLFEDRGVGFHENYDPVSWKNLSEFFSKKGWLDASSTPTKWVVQHHSVTCDGLPLVGALNSFPGIFMATGFAGRPQNFIVEVLEQLVPSILTGSPSTLPFTSNKRFL